MRKDAAVGVDGVTEEHSGQALAQGSQFGFHRTRTEDATGGPMLLHDTFGYSAREHPQEELASIGGSSGLLVR
jgi:hypothetical protein